MIARDRFFYLPLTPMIDPYISRKQRQHLSHNERKRTFWHVRPMKTQISLRILKFWSESSLPAWRKFASLAHLWLSKMIPVKILIRLRECGGWSEYLLGTNVRRYSKTCVRQPPLKLTLVVDVERWLSYKGTCHVILLAKLHDMYLFKTDNFFHINHYLKSVSKVALLHRFYCTFSDATAHC